MKLAKVPGNPSAEKAVAGERQPFETHNLLLGGSVVWNGTVVGMIGVEFGKTQENTPEVDGVSEQPHHY